MPTDVGQINWYLVVILKLLDLQNSLEAWCRFLVQKRLLLMPMVHLSHQRAPSLDPLSLCHLDCLYQIDAISQFIVVPHHELFLQSLRWSIFRDNSPFNFEMPIFEEDAEFQISHI